MGKERVDAFDNSMTPDGDPREQSREEDAQSAPDAATSRLSRLKRFFRSAYVRIIDATTGRLKRLRDRIGGPEEEQGEGEERSESRTSRKKTKLAPTELEPAAAAPHAPRSPVRSFFIYLLVLIVGIIAGMMFSFALLSNMVINQARKIGDQRDEISQLEKQYSRVLESEVKYRNRLSEIETQLNQASRATAKESAPAESSKPPAAAKEKSSISQKTGNCNLESGNAEMLSKCIDEFNRKGSR